MKTLKQLDLLFREITDLHAQENFYRIKYFAEELMRQVNALNISSGVGFTEDGSAANPFKGMNIKLADAGFFYLIPYDKESVVTVSQTINGVLTIDGVNTIL